jgi:WD40 repeat protein
MSRDALVIGINSYQYLPSLNAPARDAEAIAQQLHAYGEFRVHRLPEVIQEGKPQIGQKTPVTLRELETALINLFKPRGNSVPHTAIFYFSGHGIQREAGIREGYLALSDSNPDQGFYGLSLFWLRRLLQESPVRQRVIWLDCCHSGELLNFLEADPGASPGTDRLFMAASREYETAYESLESQYSVFTNALLSGLDPNRVAAGIVTNHSLTDWVNHTLKGEIQQPLFESSGSEIVLTRSSNGQSSSLHSSQSIQSNPSQAVCPYRGLEFFDESDAEYFFGREDLVAQLGKKLAETRFLTITGASSSGKSSLLRAGLLAQLKRNQQKGKTPWKIRLMTPTEHPLKSLAAAFIDPELSDLERAEQLRRAETFLQEGQVGLAQLVRASLSTGTTVLPTEQRPQFLLVIDQFEEAFTLSQGSQAERERQEFFDCLTGAIEIEDALSIVIALRSDFTNKCSLYEGLFEKISQQQIRVAPLKYEQIKAAIVSPAQKVGLVCEPNLVYTMLSDVIGAPGELPLLQYTLAELWQRRQTGKAGGATRLTLDAYQELSGIRGTLQKHATETFHCLTTEEQAVARRIFLTLTRLGEGTEDTRRRVAKSELITPAFPVNLVDRVLEKLVAAKLVITSQDWADHQASEESDEQDASASGLRSGSINSTKSEEIVDVAHEALIRNWLLLRGWLDETREMLRRQRRIEQAAQEWQQAGQPLAGDDLLTGLRLRDAEDFIRLYPEELSVLAQRYIEVSCTVCRRIRRKSRRLQIAIPAFLLTSLAVVLAQYNSTMLSQTEKDDQLQKATARERAAIAQAIVRDTNADPMTALLIGRLAAEGKSASYEAQSSLRAALQNLRLQLELKGHQGAVQQILFSPDHQHLATAGVDGTVRLWSINAQTIYNTSLQPEKVLTWIGQSAEPVAIASISFSPDGQHLAVIAKNSPVVKVWSVATGTTAYQFTATAAIKQLAFSPDGQWIATLSEDRTISVWQASTGTWQAHLPQTGNVSSIQFSPDGTLLLAGDMIQSWQIATDAVGTLKLNPARTFSHPEAIAQAKFSPSGRWLVTSSKNGKVRFWDSKTGQLLHLLTGEAKSTAPKQTASASQLLAANQPVLPPMQQIEFSPDEQTLATMDSDQQVWLWNSSGQLQSQFDPQPGTTLTNQSSANILQFSSDSKMIATAATTADAKGFYSVSVWNRRTGRQMVRLPGHQQPITSMQFNSDGTYLVTASADGTVRLWATAGGGELPAVQLAEDSAEWIAFLPDRAVQPAPKSDVAKPSNPSKELTDSTHQLPLTAVNQISRWNRWSNWLNFQLESLAQNQGAPERDQHSTVAPTSTAMPNAVTNMVTVAANGTLQRWKIITDTDATASTLEMTPAVHSAAIQSQDHFLSLRQKLVTLVQSPFSSLDRTNLQQAATGFAQLPQLPFLNKSSELAVPATLLEKMGVPSSATLSSFAISPNGQLMATADIEGWVSIYQVQADQSVRVLHRIRNQQFVDGSHNAVSQVINASTTTAPQHQQEQHRRSVAVRYLAFSPDSNQLLGVADDLTIRSWNTASGQQLAIFRGHSATIRRAHYSADGQRIVSASSDQTTRIWQAATGQALTMLSDNEAISNANFSPDGQKVVTTSWNGTVKVWQVSTGKQQFSNKHQKAVLDAQFSPDSRLLVTASADGTARLWNAVTGEEQALLRPNSNEEVDPIVQAFFSPDGQYVATLTQQGQVNLWAATREMLLKLAQKRTLRQLTPEECSYYLKLSPNQCPRLSQ